MPERGGPTTQSGILYQNSVAAIYLGQLIDMAACPDVDQVSELRVEAPEHVDDTVVTYADGHRVYIQVKEDIQLNDSAWMKLWSDFQQQYSDVQFVRGRDQLLLHAGTLHERHQQLRGACERASTSYNYAEWQSRLTQEQKDLVNSIKGQLDPELSEDENLLTFFKHIRVEIWPWWLIETDLVRYRISPSNTTQNTLFRLLRDHAGGEARVRGTFTASTLTQQLQQENGVILAAPPNLNDLRSAVSACGDLLRQQRNTIGATGLHINRAIVEEIVAWALTDEDKGDKEPVALLLDRAGIGKTVVLRDVMQRVESSGVPVLAIKTDLQLSGVASYDELQQRLQLPEPVVRAVNRLAAQGRVVVVIDQLDALSLSMARDQQALTVALQLIAWLRRIPGVRVVVSCRTFDWNSDPRLRNVGVGPQFSLTELTDEEVRHILESVSVDINALAPPARSLLRVPLHLDLVVRAIENQPIEQRQVGGIESLQDLYALLWQAVILKPDPAGPPISERVEVLRLMTERMHREQQTVVPQAAFTTPQAAHLQPTLAWLTSAGIVVQGVGEWTFLHQTFFDYCYAMEFVESGGQLAATILSGDQGFAARPHLVQVLGYLRGTNHTAYIRELSTLLHANDLRYHLCDLTLNFFGLVVSPTDQEWVLARRLLADAEMRPKLLSAMYGQPRWWPRIRQEMLPGMMQSDDTTLGTEVLPYLASLIDIAQGDVAAILRPYVGRSDHWNARIAWVLSRVRQWKATEALDVFLALFEYEAPSRELLYQVREVASVSPAHGCRLVHAILDRLLDAYIAKLNTSMGEVQDLARWVFSRPTLYNELEALNGSMFVETVTMAAEVEPQLFLDLMLPWLKRVLDLTPDRNDAYSFTDDDLSGGWHDHVSVVKLTLISALRTALIKLAERDPAAFRNVARQLAELPYETPQQLLPQAYAAMPEQFAEEAAAFLLEDPRRLSLGDHEHYETRQLISAVYPFLPPNKRQDLESYFLSYRPVRSKLGLDGLRWSGLEQLYLLQAIPEHLLSQRGVRQLRELERKFPGVKPSKDPITIRSGMVGPPIGADVALLMSDRAWLNAMKHYQGDVRHSHPFKGGADQLSGVLATLIRGDAERSIPGDPERFYRLLQRVPATVDDAYVQGYLNGFAESSAPAEQLFSIVRRFWGQSGRGIRRTAAWALEKRVEEGLPDDLLALLEQQVRSPMGDDEVLRENGSRDPYDRYLNSDRGASFRTLMRALDQRGTTEAMERKWSLIEFAASDPSSSLRAGALEQLLYLLGSDGNRAVALFEQFMAGHPVLLQSHFASEFIYYALYRYFVRMQPFITAMMLSDVESVQQRGAELAAITYISKKANQSPEVQADAKALADRAIHGEVPLRRGVARIYAYNLADATSEECDVGLRSLLNDDDETVRRTVGGAIHMLRGDHFLRLRGFLESYAASRTAQTELREFTEYLLEHGLLYPDWTLTIVETLLANLDRSSEEFRFGYSGGENLIRLVIRIYNDPTSSYAIRRRAMDLFDQLMEQFMGQTRLVLAEWDRW